MDFKKMLLLILSFGMLILIACSGKVNIDPTISPEFDASSLLKPSPYSVSAIRGEGPFHGGIKSEKPFTCNLYQEYTKTTAMPIIEIDIAAGQFYATTSFTQLEVNCPSYSNNIGNLTLSLYKWNKDYTSTLSQNPLYIKDFVNYTDNSWLELTFDTLSDGEYLWTLSNPTETVGVWFFLPALENTRAYLGGQEVEGSYQSRIKYTNTPKINLAILSNGFDFSNYVSNPSKVENSNDYPINILDPFPDTWVATDGLGRTLPTYEQVGDVKKDKFVGIFYLTWLDSFSSFDAININTLTTQHPEAKNDLNFPGWGSIRQPHFWNEPIWGYYKTTDRYVLRKQAEMLANAGVDVIICDATNHSETYKPAYTQLFDVFEEARKQGVKTPQIAFILNFSPSPDTRTSLRSLYFDLYRNSRYQDLWFYWKDKPLIMAYPESLNVSDPIDYEISQFFTFRPGQPEYNLLPTRLDQWGWLGIYPQQKYGEKNGKIEEMTVGVAQNWSDEIGLTAMNGKNIFGRSYTNKNGFSTDPNSKLYGLNVQEQWDYAISQDPEFIFVDGWNEWVAERFSEWRGVINAFPDQYNDEFSRDIEPSKGDLKDHYYYQFVSNIRKFKGVTKPLESSGNKKIDIKSNDDQWNDVKPEFRHYLGSIPNRDCAGWKGYYYTNNTGRNDIIMSKVTYDDENIYFMVDTDKPLSPKTDPAWMRLLIDTKLDGTNNWEGYEFIVNRINPDGKATLESSNGGWNWTEVGKIDYTISNNRMQIAIPRQIFGLTTGKPEFNFKWSDNMQEDGNIMDFYSNGEAAPSGRFMFHYKGEQSDVDIKSLASNNYIIIIISACIVIIGGAVTILIIINKKRKINKILGG